MATTGHRNLVERGERNSFVRDNGLAHTQKKKNNKLSGKLDIHESKTKDSST